MDDDTGSDQIDRERLLERWGERVLCVYDFVELVILYGVNSGYFGRARVSLVGHVAVF